MGVTERIKTQAVTLGFAAVVIALLFVVTAVLPFDLLPFYLAGWFLTLVSINLKGTGFVEGKTEVLFFIADGIALFLFVIVGFLSFVFSDFASLLVAIGGTIAAFYSMSL